MSLNIVTEIDNRVSVRHVLMSVSDKTGLDTFVPALAQELASHGGTLGLDTRFKLMKKSFAHTAAYDTAIAQFFTTRTWEEVDRTYNQH